MEAAVQLDSTPDKKKIFRDFSTDILPEQDSSMKVSLTGLPNKLRGVAWPSSARTLRRAVKSVNMRQANFYFRLAYNERARPTPSVATTFTTSKGE